MVEAAPWMHGLCVWTSYLPSTATCVINQSKSMRYPDLLLTSVNYVVVWQFFEVISGSFDISKTRLQRDPKIETRNWRKIKQEIETKNMKSAIGLCTILLIFNSEALNSGLKRTVDSNQGKLWVDTPNRGSRHLVIWC